MNTFNYYGPASGQSEEQIRSKQNLVEVSRKLYSEGSSEGWSAGNREQWLSVVRGIDTSGDNELKRMVDMLISQIKGAQKHPGDPLYNMLVTNEMSLTFDELKTYIEKRAAAEGIDREQ